jgi:hypothetical protein
VKDKCSWCNKKLLGHPVYFDLKIYSNEDYKTKYRFYFCTECYNKIGKFVVENKIKPIKR